MDIVSGYITDRQVGGNMLHWNAVCLPVNIPEDMNLNLIPVLALIGSAGLLVSGNLFP